MKIIHMIEGEYIKELDFKSKLTPLIPELDNEKFIDITASKFVRRLERMIKRNEHFVESGMSEDRRGPHFWFIFWTGDNCLKVYPEVGGYIV